MLRDSEWKGHAKRINWRAATMSLEQTLNDTLTQAIRDKDGG